jgi:hypothetical protein
LAKSFAEKEYININIHTHICVKFRPKKHISLLLPVQPKKNSKNKKGWQKGESLAGGNTKKGGLRAVD